MANNNEARNELENIKKRMAEQTFELGNARVAYQHAHQHHPNLKGGVKLEPVTNAKILEKYGLAADTPDIFKCGGTDGCGKVFSAAAYTAEQVNAAEFQMESMLEQMKFNAPEGEFPGGKEQLDQFYAAIEIIERFFEGYNKMIAKQNEGEKNKNGNHRPAARGGVGRVNYYGNNRSY